MLRGSLARLAVVVLGLVCLGAPAAQAAHGPTMQPNPPAAGAVQAGVRASAAACPAPGPASSQGAAPTPAASGCAGGATAQSADVVATAKRKPQLTLDPAATGPIKADIRATIENCPKGPITVTNSLHKGSITIPGAGKTAHTTIKSSGKPGFYTVTAQCSNGVDARAQLTVGKSKSNPVLTVSPTSSGPFETPLRLTVTRCPDGPVDIRSTFSEGKKTVLAENGKAHAKLVSPGDPGTYTISARCIDGGVDRSPFVVTPRGGAHTGDGTMSAGPDGGLIAAGAGLIGLVLLGGAAGLGRRRLSSRSR